MEDFTRDDISLLYYFGYLTIREVNIVGGVKFRVPNYVMKMNYGNYLLKILNDFEIRVNREKINDALLEIAESGKIDKITDYVSEVLSMHDNKFFMNFDENISNHYISVYYKIILQCIYT